MDQNEIDDLYRDAILDHSRNPRNRRRLEHPTVSGRAVNPFCGDEIAFQIDLHDGHATGIAAQAVGCSINRASASMLTEALHGKTLDDMASLAARLKAAMADADGPIDFPPELSDLSTLVGVRQFPVRIKCALLSWSALEEALEAYQRQEQGVTAAEGRDAEDATN